MHTNSNSPFRIVVLLSGRGSNFIAIDQHLKSNAINAQIVAVVSDRSRAQGLSYAKEQSIEHRVVPRRAKERSIEDFSTELTNVVSSFSPDLVVLAGFMRLVAPPFTSAFENKAINIHPSLLPDFPGLKPQQQAIDAGAQTSGCTIHLVTEEMDSGPIIAQASVPVLAGDSEISLSNRILEEEHRIYPQIVELFALGALVVEKTEGNQSRIELKPELLEEDKQHLLKLITH